MPAAQAGKCPKGVAKKAEELRGAVERAAMYLPAEHVRLVAARRLYDGRPLATDFPLSKLGDCPAVNRLISVSPPGPRGWPPALRDYVQHKVASNLATAEAERLGQMAEEELWAVDWATKPALEAPRFEVSGFPIRHGVLNGVYTEDPDNPGVNGSPHYSSTVDTHIYYSVKREKWCGRACCHKHTPIQHATRTQLRALTPAESFECPAVRCGQVHHHLIHARQDQLHRCTRRRQ